jgi:propanol-preferring alcohol dehydrogenase
MGPMSIEVPKTQKAQVLEKYGGQVVYKDIPVPEPGPDEVLVNIKVRSVQLA